MANKNLNQAKNAKKDEFYTQLVDIENELRHYREHFRGKTVLCNCDDPRVSNFFHYFSYNFEQLGLFREYINQLMKYNKKFLIIGNINAVSYKETFQLFKEGKVWLGASIHSGDREFGVPDDYPLTAAGWRLDENGKKYIRVKGVRWFTNLDFKERHEELILYKHYTPEEYPKYDNYDAININKTTDIPTDYDGIIGVPITFLDKYCPDQFDIIGNELDLNIDKGRGYINGKRMYSRIFIKHKHRYLLDCDPLPIAAES